MANQGWTVVGISYNKKGSGHMVTVRPSDQTFDPTQGPEVSNVGTENKVMSAKKAFGKAFSDAKFYYDPGQTFENDQSKVNRSWGY
jgi:hypothetical protein